MATTNYDLDKLDSALEKTTIVGNELATIIENTNNFINGLDSRIKKLYNNTINNIISLKDNELDKDYTAITSGNGVANWLSNATTSLKSTIASVNDLSDSAYTEYGDNIETGGDGTSDNDSTTSESDDNKLYNITDLAWASILGVTKDELVSLLKKAGYTEEEILDIKNGKISIDKATLDSLKADLEEILKGDDGQALIDKIKEIFGVDILNSDGEIDTNVLALLLLASGKSSTDELDIEGLISEYKEFKLTIDDNTFTEEEANTIEDKLKEVGYSDDEINNILNGDVGVKQKELDELTDSIEEAYNNDSSIRDKIKDLYGIDIFNDDGAIDSNKLALVMLIDGKNSTDKYDITSLLTQIDENNIGDTTGSIPGTSTVNTINNSSISNTSNVDSTYTSVSGIKTVSSTENSTGNSTVHSGASFSSSDTSTLSSTDESLLNSFVDSNNSDTADVITNSSKAALGDVKAISNNNTISKINKSSVGAVPAITGIGSTLATAGGLTMAIKEKEKKNNNKDKDSKNETKKIDSIKPEDKDKDKNNLLYILGAAGAGAGAGIAYANKDKDDDDNDKEKTTKI